MKEDLRLRAERENVNKSKFLADAAHDLRQPMQALSNYLEAADSAAQRSDVRKCAELIGMSQTALRLALGPYGSMRGEVRENLPYRDYGTKNRPHEINGLQVP
jgi:signal transduction histidine kinase